MSRTASSVSAVLVAGVLVGAASCGVSTDDADAPQPGVTARPADTTTAAAPLSTSETAPSTEQVGAPSTTASVPVTPASSPMVDVPEELAFTAPLVDGGELDLATLAGQPVLLWFWAPWCPTCNREADSVREAAERWAGQAEFVGVAWQGSTDDYRRFIDDYSLEFPHVADQTGEYFARFGVAAQPAFAIVRPDGEVQVLLGAADDTLLDSLIADALA